jgi:hypothetical protein
VGCSRSPAARPRLRSTDLGSRSARANFAIYSTLSERDARALLEDLELFRAVLLRVTKLRDTAPRVPTEIYAFDRRERLRAFPAEANYVGYFVPTLRQQSRGALDRRGRHALSRRAVPRVHALPAPQRGARRLSEMVRRRLREL